MIKTERIKLRNWRIEDSKALYNLAKDPDVANPGGWPVHTSVEMSREVIETVFNDPEIYAIVLDSSDEVIGCIGATEDKSCPINIGDRVLGYWVGKAYFNKGYTTEAAIAFIHHIFDHYDCGTIWCGNFVDNIASVRVQEKCGFKFHHTDLDKNWGMSDEGRDVQIRYLVNPKKVHEKKYL